MASCQVSADDEPADERNLFIPTHTAAAADLSLTFVLCGQRCLYSDVFLGVREMNKNGAPRF